MKIQKMQRLSFLVLLCLIGNISIAQEVKTKKFYIETSGGYGFPLVNDDLGSTNDLIGPSNQLFRADSTIKITPVQGTQGPGWQFSFNVGYMFHPNIGVEGQVNYVRSNAFLLAKYESPTYQAEHSVVGQRLDLIPQLVFNFEFRQKWSAYSKSGLIIPVWGKSSSEIKIEDQEGRLAQELLNINNPNTQASARLRASTFGKFSYGFQTRLGVGYKVLDWLSVFGELKFVALSIRSKEDRLDDVQINLYNELTNSGLTLTLDDLDEINQRTIYVDELNENSNNPSVNSNPDPNKPLETLATKDNFNQLGLSFGLRFYLK